MAEKRKGSFVLYAFQYASIKDLTDKQKAILLDSIFQYVITSENPAIEDGEVRMAFKFIKGQIDFDNEKYASICEKRREYGRLGGKAKGGISLQEEHKQASEADMENDNDKDKDKDKDMDKQGSEDPMSLKRKNKIKKEFVPPTLKEVEDYIRQKGYSFSARAFIDYYEADDWHYGNGSRRVKMTNWKRACAQWGNMHKDDGDANVRDEYPRSVEELREEDWCCNFWYFMPWLDKKCPRLSAMRLGFPTSPEQYDAMVKHTEGGYKMLCYITLVLERDGWEEYNDERGFMWIYKKYIEKNGLSKASA